jgi:hypothetical protein
VSERGMEQPTPRLPGWWTLARDIGSFLGGWALIFSEVQRPDLRESVLVLAAGIVGVPAAAVGAQTVVEALATRRNGTGGSSSSPPEAQPEPSPLPPS